MNSTPVVIQGSDRDWETWSQDLIATRGRVHWKTLISDDITDSSALTVGLGEIMPGEKLARHRHAQPEVYYITEGTGVMMFEEEEQVVEAGTAIFIPGSAIHGIRNESDAPVRWIYIFPADSFGEIKYVFENAT